MGQKAGTRKNRRPTAYVLALIGLMTALMCILGPVTIVTPFSPVPLSLASLAIYFGVWLLGWKWGTMSCLIYLLLGLTGMPVFSGFTGGPGKLMGPTGGYLIGYLFLTVIAGGFVQKWKSRGWRLLGLVLGTWVLYLFGTVWLARVADMSLTGAFAAGVLPFLPLDVSKLLLVFFTAPVVESRLREAGLVPEEVLVYDKKEQENQKESQGTSV